MRNSFAMDVLRNSRLLTTGDRMKLASTVAYREGVANLIGDVSCFRLRYSTAEKLL